MRWVKSWQTPAPAARKSSVLESKRVTFFRYSKLVWMWPPSASICSPSPAPAGIDTPWLNLRRAALPRTGPPSWRKSQNG